MDEICKQYYERKKKMNGTSTFLQQLWKQPLVEYGDQAKQLNPMISILCCFFFFILILLKLFKPPKQTLKFPPSPPKLPLIGNLHQLGTLPHRSLSSLAAKHGPLMLLKLGQTPTLVVSSPNMAKQVMKTHDLKFCNRPRTTATSLLFYDCQDVGFSPYGEYWRQAKKMCALELFSAKRVESFQHVRDEEIGVLVRRVRDAEAVDLSKMMVTASNNIVSRCVLGEKFEDEDGNSRFGDVARRIMELLVDFCVQDYFPAFGWVDVARGFVRELKRVSKIMDDFFDVVIEEHSLKLRSGKSDDKKDFVDIMLQLSQNDMLDYHFTRDNLKAIIQDLFVGGSETTSTSIEWAMAELIKNPPAMKKVQQEIRTIVGNKPKIEPNDINKMEYLNCVIKESLRLHPPAPLLVPRETSDSVDIEGYHVAPKTRVLVNAWAIQRDPDFWESPNEFIPERFTNKNDSVDFKGQDFELVPFGSGRRKCPGIFFGGAILEYVLANLLYWFDWKLPNDMPGELLDMTEQYGITVRKKIPLHLNPLPYVV